MTSGTPPKGEYCVLFPLKITRRIACITRLARYAVGPHWPPTEPHQTLFRPSLLCGRLPLTPNAAETGPLQGDSRLPAPTLTRASKSSLVGVGFWGRGRNRRIPRPPGRMRCGRRLCVQVTFLGLQGPVSLEPVLKEGPLGLWQSQKQGQGPVSVPRRTGSGPASG